MSQPYGYYPGYHHPPPPPNMLSTLLQAQQVLSTHQKTDGKTFVCKIYFTNEEETRRMKINKEMNYEGLLLFVENYLKPFGTGLRLHKMAYLDDEDEWVNFSTESEWKDCLGQVALKKNQMVKIKVITKGNAPVKRVPVPLHDFQEEPVEKVEEPKKKKKEVEEEIDLVAEKPVLPKHPYKCDKCGMNPIIGKRYACTTKKDFDVCENCYRDREKNGLVNEGWNVFMKPGEISYSIPPKKMMHTAMPRVVKKPEPPKDPMTSSLGSGQDKMNEPTPKELPADVEPDYKNKIQLLKEMGFHDEVRSLKLLRKHKGELQAVVREHLSA